MKITVSTMSLILTLSEAMDFINPLLVKHHKKTSYIAYRIGQELGLYV